MENNFICLAADLSTTTLPLANGDHTKISYTPWYNNNNNNALFTTYSLSVRSELMNIKTHNLSNLKNQV